MLCLLVALLHYRPAVKSLWASPEATAADVAAPEVPYGGVTPTPSTAASPRRHLDHGNLDVISLSSEDDATYSTEGASAFASAGASKVSVPGSTQAAASAAGGGNGGDGKQPLLELLELLAGPEVGGRRVSAAVAVLFALDSSLE
jgi:hypothetical protein